MHSFQADSAGCCQQGECKRMTHRRDFLSWHSRKEHECVGVCARGFRGASRRKPQSRNPESPQVSLSWLTVVACARCNVLRVSMHVKAVLNKMTQVSAQKRSDSKEMTACR